MESYGINALKSNKTKQEQAYDEIKNAIVKCYMKPGEQLVIRSLASQLQISEIPVREALKTLISGNFVVERNSNLYVAPISATEFLDMLEVKLGLEVLAIKVTLKRIDEDKLLYLKSLINEMTNVYDENNIALYKEAHFKFHLALCRMCGVSYLIKAIEDAFSHHDRGLNYFGLKMWEDHPTFEEHIAIVNALEKKDMEAAVKYLINNRSKASELYKRQMKKFI